MKHYRVLAAAVSAFILLGLAACGSPYLYGKADDPGAPGKVSLTDTKFDYQMIFDCFRSSTATTFTASALNTPMDDAKSSAGGPYYTIAELDSSNVAYNATYYITLDITTSGDGDTISTAALTLRNASGTSIRTISANGAITYLGSEGFIYISSKSSAGYFFSSKPHAKGETVTYAYSKAMVTKKSELGW